MLQWDYANKNCIGTLDAAFPQCDFSCVSLKQLMNEKQALLMAILPPDWQSKRSWIKYKTSKYAKKVANNLVVLPSETLKEAWLLSQSQRERST